MVAQLHIIDGDFRVAPAKRLGWDRDATFPSGAPLGAAAWRFRQCLALGFQIHGQVLVSRVEAGVPQPVGDGAQVDAGTQRMDGGTVS